jgi:hypothetical protein
MKRAVWIHRHGDKHPRPTHLAMHGKEYDLANGMHDPAEGRNVMPGELFGCTCGFRLVPPGEEGNRNGRV